MSEISKHRHLRALQSEDDPAGKPLRVAPKIKAAPKVRQISWCDFQKDAQLPELWKRRPVIVLSYRNTLHGAVTVIPTTSDASRGDPWLLPLSVSLDERVSYAICDKPTTVAVSRLHSMKRKVPRLSEAEFNGLLARLFDWLPRLP